MSEFEKLVDAVIEAAKELGRSTTHYDAIETGIDKKRTRVARSALLSRIAEVETERDEWRAIARDLACEYHMGNNRERGASAISKYPIICFSGSTQFKDEFFRLHKEFTLAGYISLVPAVFAKCGDVVTKEQQDELFALHIAKIGICDILYVINKGGKIGASTKTEIAYAEQLGKKIMYMEPIRALEAKYPAHLNSQVSTDVKESEG